MEKLKLKTEYDVVRLIQQGRSYHIVMDCVEGKILAEYVADVKQIKKEEIFSWFQQMAEQLWCFENSWHGEPYQLITPFSMILKENGEIALLDFYTKDSRMLLDELCRKRNWKIFCREVQLDDDLYCFGKTLQYFLAKVVLVPTLSMREEWILKKVINRCIGKYRNDSYRDFQDVIFDLRRL